MHSHDHSRATGPEIDRVQMAVDNDCRPKQSPKTMVGTTGDASVQFNDLGLREKRFFAGFRQLDRGTVLHNNVVDVAVTNSAPATLRSETMS